MGSTQATTVLFYCPLCILLTLEAPTSTIQISCKNLYVSGCWQLGPLGAGANPSIFASNSHPSLLSPGISCWGSMAIITMLEIDFFSHRKISEAETDCQTLTTDLWLPREQGVELDRIGRLGLKEANYYIGWMDSMVLLYTTGILIYIFNIL